MEKNEKDFKEIKDFYLKVSSKFPRKEKKMEQKDRFKRFESYQYFKEKREIKKTTHKDPWEIFEIFTKILAWVNQSVEYRRFFLKKFIFPFSICIFFDLFRRNFFNEAKIFLSRFGLNELIHSHGLFEKKIISWQTKTLDETKVIEEIEKKIFTINIPRFIKEQLLTFLEKTGKSYFLEFLSQKFLINSIEESDCLEKKEKLLLYEKNAPKKLTELPVKNVRLLKPIRSTFLESKKIFEKPKTSLDSLKNYRVLKILQKKRNYITCASISKDENLLITGSRNSSIMGFDLTKKTGKKNHFSLIGHSSGVFVTKISPDTKFMLSGSLNGEVFIWSLRYKKILGRYEHFSDPVWDASLSKNGDLFVTACGNSTSSLWSPTRLFPLRLFIGHTFGVNVVKWHPNQRFLITGSSDHTIGIWDIRTAKRIGSFRTFDRPIQAADFSPSGNEISFGGLSRFIDTWDLRADKLLRRIKEKKDIKNIGNISYSQDGKYFGYIGNHQMVQIWSNETYKNNTKKIGTLFHVNQIESTESGLNHILDFAFSQKSKGVISGTTV